MEITIKKSEFTYGGTKYITFNMFLKNKNVSLTINDKNKQVNILYKNAMSVAYKGSGKSFDNIDLAILSYKDASILSMLNYSKFYLCN